MTRLERLGTVFLLLFLFSSVGLNALPQPEQTPPARRQVAEVIDGMKAEESASHQEAARRAHVLGQMGKWLQSNTFYVRLLVVIAGVLLVLVLGYLLLRFFLRLASTRTSRVVDRRASGRGGREFNAAHIDGLEKAGRFDEALLYLHRMSIESLLERKILQARNLTNASILDRLSDKKLSQNFQTIASLSERVLFDRLSPTSLQYGPCRKAYNAAFGENV